MRKLKIEGLKLIQNRIFRDERGFFTEHYKKDYFSSLGLPDFVQHNHSRSKPGVIRGLHFQTEPAAQAKLVSVIHGRIWDVAVDLRKGSSTYGQWEAVDLSDENGLQLWIPHGFAHGFCVLGDQPADVFYKVDQPYSQIHEKGIIFNDPSLGIEWPVENPIVSEKDLSLDGITSLL
jgi:dTDP-4-dehydrorhamnose 3,5-epimerase